MKRAVKQRPWILPIALTVILVLTPAAYATMGVDVEENQCGLVIEAAGDGEDIGNLYPGDRKQSQLRLVNEGENLISSIAMKTQIVHGSESSPRGGDLADVLRLTIKNGDDFLVNDLPFRDAAHLSAIELGSMVSGSEMVLDFYLFFPTTAGNEYQGSSFQANWYFATSCDSNGDPGGGDPGGGGETGTGGGTGSGQTNVPEAQVPQGQIPLGPGITRPNNETVIITVEGDPIPFGPGVVLPRTGEANPLGFVWTGSLFILLGLLWRKTDESEIRYGNETS